MLIGLSGFAQSGKDTVAKYLIEEHGYTRLAFADVLRRALYTLNPIILVSNEGAILRLKEHVDEVGWEEAKKIEEVRKLLQVFGTEVGRALLGENVWVNLALKEMKEDRDYVFTDVRFLNEANLLRDRGGSIWRIERPSVEAVNQHLSERALEGYNFDFKIINDSTLDDLAEKVEIILDKLAQ